MVLGESTDFTIFNFFLPSNRPYRPVALTAIIMKFLEQIILNNELKTVEPHLDPLKFADTVR